GCGELELRLRREAQLAAAGEAGAMIEKCEPDALVGAGVRVALAAEIRPPNRLTQHLQRAAVVAQPLACGSRVAGAKRIPLAKRHRIDAQRSGDAVHVCLD